jgi:vacuolar protein sorting-associated protein 51
LLGDQYNFLSNVHHLTVSPCILGEFQESVISTVLKLCLKSLQEFVRLQTFNRSGFQQIQLDMEFLKNYLKEFIDDEAAVSFLLKEV